MKKGFILTASLLSAASVFGATTSVVVDQQPMGVDFSKIMPTQRNQLRKIVTGAQTLTDTDQALKELQKLDAVKTSDKNAIFRINFSVVYCADA